MFLTRAIQGLLGYGTTVLSNWCIIFSDSTLVCHLQRSHMPLRSVSWNMNDEFINWTFDPWRYNHYVASERQAGTTYGRGAIDNLKSRGDCMFLIRW